MMRLLLLLAALSGALAGALRERRDAQECVCPNSPQRGYWGGGLGGRSAFSDPDLAEGRLANQHARLEHLEEEIDALTKEYEELTAGRTERLKKFNKLKNRIFALEKDEHCDEDHFACHDQASNCIGHNAVCDGFKDCLNGHDEDEETCTPVGVGASYEAIFPEPDPCTSRKPGAFRFVITKVTVPDLFPEEPRVNGVVVMTPRAGEEGSTESFAVSGVYDYTHRRVILYSPDNDNLDFECTFHVYDDDHCHGAFRREPSGDICYSFQLHKLDH